MNLKRFFLVQFKLAGLFCLAVLLASCSSTYPKGSVDETIVQLAMDDYELKIQAKLQDATLGVLFEQSSLFKGFPENVTEEELPSLVAGMEFSEEGQKDFGHVFQAVWRTALSAEVPPEFYTLIARDQTSQVEHLITGNIVDLKRTHIDIPISDFNNRSLYGVRVEPKLTARRTVERFLNHLAVRPATQVLRDHISEQANLTGILPVMVQLASEQGGQPERLLEQPMFAIQISPSEALVHLKAEGAHAAYLFGVELLSGRPGKIMTLNALRNSEQLPMEFRDLPPISEWEDQWYFQSHWLPQFLADQISRRFQGSWINQGVGALNLAVAGRYQDEVFDFQFRYLKLPAQLFGSDLNPVLADGTGADPNAVELAASLAKTASEVCYSYRFDEFRNIMITDVLEGTQWQVSAVDLPLYRRKHPPELPLLP